MMNKEYTMNSTLKLCYLLLLSELSFLNLVVYLLFTHLPKMYKRNNASSSVAITKWRVIRHNIMDKETSYRYIYLLTAKSSLLPTKAVRTMLIGFWSIESLQHLTSYQDGYCLVTVHTHGDFIVPPHWEIRPPTL